MTQKQFDLQIKKILERRIETLRRQLARAMVAAHDPSSLKRVRVRGYTVEKYTVGTHYRVISTMPRAIAARMPVRLLSASA